MTDSLHKLLKTVDHDRYAVLLPAIILALGALIFAPMFACSPKTQSILDPGKQVTRVELNMEIVEAKARLDAEKAVIEKERTDCLTASDAKVVAWNAKGKSLEEKAAIGHAEITAKEEHVGAIFDTVSLVVQAVAPPGYAGIALSVLGIAGMGYGVGKRADASRKDVKLQELKTEIERLKATPPAMPPA